MSEILHFACILCSCSDYTFFFHIVYPTYVNKIVLIEGRNISLAENPGRIFSLEKGQHIYIFAVLGRIHWSMHWKSAQ